MAGSPASIITTVYIGSGNPAQIGTTTTPVFGATGQVGFFGNPTTTQPTTSLQAAPSATAAVSISATQFGFSTSTQADAVVNCVRSMQAALVSLGLIKGS